MLIMLAAVIMLSILPSANDDKVVFNSGRVVLAAILVPAYQKSVAWSHFKENINIFFIIFMFDANNNILAIGNGYFY